MAEFQVWHIHCGEYGNTLLQLLVHSDPVANQNRIIIQVEIRYLKKVLKTVQTISTKLDTDAP